MPKTRRSKRTTMCKPTQTIALKQIEQNFITDKSNQVMLYLATVLDLYSPGIIAWNISQPPYEDRFVKEALKMALLHHKNDKVRLIHSIWDIQ